jgi:hypothetical protein
MSEPLLERLSRFTPHAAGLDRDALIFEAGRRSARADRRWVTLAGLLASTQVLSLVVLWPRPTQPAAGLPVQVVTAPALSTPSEPLTSEALANPGLWTARPKLIDSEIWDRPDGDVSFIESGPPLRALALPPPSLLN